MHGPAGILRPWTAWRTRIPTGDWVLHTVPELGTVTERWIETQIRSQSRYDSMLLGGRMAAGQDQPLAHWIVARQHWLTRLSHRGMYRLDGLSLVVLAALFRRRRPSILHAHHGTASAMYRWLARAMEVPLVVSFYGADACSHSITRSGLWRRRYRRLFAFAEAVLVEGPAMAERVRRLGCPPEKLHVIRLPADAEGLAGLAHSAPGEFEVAAAGRFIEKKGFDTAISAFARSLAGESARLVLIGGGPLDDELRALADELGVGDQVVFLGRMPFTEFTRRALAASISVYPSREAADGDSDGGAPVSLIEAQWAGQPVLVSHHDDLPFVTPADIEPLPVDDIDAWAAALRRAFDRRQDLPELGQRCARFVRAAHSPAQNAKEREDVYSTVVERRAMARRSGWRQRHP